jgi:hypothetical protein
MQISHDNNPQQVFDKHFTIKCPHCGAVSNITAISIPRYEFTIRFQLTKLGVVYRCDACNAPVFLRFTIAHHSGNSLTLNPAYEEIEKPLETYEYRYLPEAVAEDFREALTCYSHASYNAFAAMCRRCIQSSCMELGVSGKDRVSDQIKEVKDTAGIDDETYDILQQVIVSGHDGAHPHLPKLSSVRAGILLELMKDVLYQLFVRKAKIKESMDARRQAINQSKANEEV